MGHDRSRVDQQSRKKPKNVSPTLLKRINRNTDLNRLADWLEACGITSAAMKATGV